MGNNNSHPLLRSSSISGIYSGTDESSQILNSYQKAILRTAWRRLISSKNSQSSCGRTILKRLTLKDPSIKAVFQHFSVLGNVLAQTTHPTSNHCGFEGHADAFIQLLEFVMNNLDRPQMIAEKCKEIGKAHRRVKIFGMKTDHLDLCGESITETVREYQGWRRHRQAVGATNIIISFVVDRIRSGFLQRLEVCAFVKTPQPSIDQDSDSTTSSRHRTKNANQLKNQEIKTRWEKTIQNVVNNNVKNQQIIQNKPVNNSRRRFLPLPPPGEITILHQDILQDADVLHEFHSIP